LDSAFTDRTRGILEQARSEAARRAERSIGTEYLLLAVAQKPSERLSLLFTRLAVDAMRLREAVEKRLPPPTPPALFHSDLPYSRDAMKVLERATERARELGDRHIGPEHLFLGIVSNARGITVDVLAELRVSPTRAREAAEAMAFGAPAPPRRPRGRE
jgi:ATP-dependent Clp protease ATP-binding subunit ClpC